MTEAELKEIGDRNLFRGGGDEGCRCSTCDASRLVAEVRRLRAALVGIAEHPHCTDASTCCPEIENTDDTEPDELFAHGHRCAAEMARAALEGK